MHVVEDACITVAPDGPHSEKDEGGETFPQGRKNPPGRVSPPLKEAIGDARRWKWQPAPGEDLVPDGLGEWALGEKVIEGFQHLVTEDAAIIMR